MYDLIVYLSPSLTDINQFIGEMWRYLSQHCARFVVGTLVILLLGDNSDFIDF